VVVADPPDRPGDVGEVAVGEAELADGRALLADGTPGCSTFEISTPSMAVLPSGCA
jgi:hypothetical protein